MSKRIFEFVCEEGHISEVYIDAAIRATYCKECDKLATRIISKPMVKLEGVTGSFPGAYMQWERRREEKMKQEKRAADN
jgi:hypothetical protein